MGINVVKMFRKIDSIQAVAIALLLSFTADIAVAGYEQNPEAIAFMEQLSAEQGFEQRDLQQWFTSAEKKQPILDAISRPAEKVLTWGEYRNIFLTHSRIEKGVEFWRHNREVLAEVEQKYGVPAEIIVAIIGVETLYGKHKGSYRVIDALSTLAFDYPKRQPFFTKELKHYLLLAREQGQDPLALMGSYAGAMGYGQFMPSSFREYAVDYDGDHFADIWNNEHDAIASVANYFVRHGWVAGDPIAFPAKVTAAFNSEVVRISLKPYFTVGQLQQKGFSADQVLTADAPATAMALDGDQGVEYWLGLNNFYVITRYNHSHMYAMAVYQLSQEILKQSKLAASGAE